MNSMKRFFQVLLGAVVAAVTVAAQAQMPQAPEVAAKAYLLLDVTANRYWPPKTPIRRSSPHP